MKRVGIAAIVVAGLGAACVLLRAVVVHCTTEKA